MTKKTETIKLPEVSRTIPADIAATTFILGAKAYNPRAAHNSFQWEKMQALLAAAGDKGVKGDVLAKSLATHAANPDASHFNFVGYLKRHNHLASKAK